MRQSTKQNRISGFIHYDDPERELILYTNGPCQYSDYGTSHCGLKSLTRTDFHTRWSPVSSHYPKTLL